MANWEDIVNNRLTMGRSRWLCYGSDEERRRENEEVERRLGVRPLVDGRAESESQRAIRHEQILMENFSRHWVRGRSRPILTPRPFIQVHHGLLPSRPPRGAVFGFGRVTCGPGLDNFGPHLPGPQHYLPPPSAPNQEENAADPSSESSAAGEGSP